MMSVDVIPDVSSVNQWMAGSRHRADTRLCCWKDVKAAGRLRRSQPSRQSVGRHYPARLQLTTAAAAQWGKCPDICPTTYSGPRPLLVKQGLDCDAIWNHAPAPWYLPLLIIVHGGRCQGEAAKKRTLLVSAGEHRPVKMVQILATRLNVDQQRLIPLECIYLPDQCWQISSLRLSDRSLFSFSCW